jgi:hypothetical protein
LDTSGGGEQVAGNDFIGNDFIGGDDDQPLQLAGDDFGKSWDQDSSYGNDYGWGANYEQTYRAKGGGYVSNFKNADNLGFYKSGLTHHADGGVTDDSGFFSTVPDTVKKVGAQANLGGQVAGWYEYDPETMQFKWHSNTKKTDAAKNDADVVTDFVSEISSGRTDGPAAPTPGDPNSYTGGLLSALLGTQYAAPIVDASNFASVAAAEAAATKDLAAQYGMQGVSTLGGTPNSSPSADPGARNDPGTVGGWGSRDAGGGGGAGDGGGPGSPGRGGGIGGGGMGSSANGGPGGDARGGFFSRGKFNFHPAKVYAGGGLSDALYNLGSYSDGGRLLKGPGDGVSDSIPATIGRGQPARLADGEFVIPARIVSELGNGSTDAGARKLYAMMDRIQAARKRTVGKGRVATNSRAEKYLPR